MTQYKISIVLTRFMPLGAFNCDFRKLDEPADPDFERRPFAAFGTLPEILRCAYESNRHHRYMCFFNKVRHTRFGSLHTRNMGACAFRGDEQRISRFKNPDHPGEQRPIIIAAVDGDDTIGVENLSLKGLVEHVDRTDNLKLSGPEGAGKRRIEDGDVI